MKLQTAFQQLPQEVQDELSAYIDDGNDKADIIRLFLNHMDSDALISLLVEIKRTHVVNGDFPHTSALEVELGWYDD